MVMDFNHRIVAATACRPVLISLIALVLVVLLSGCRKSRSDQEPMMGTGYMAMSLRSINIDGDQETTIKTVRLVIAKYPGGEVVYNQLLTWNNGSETLPANISTAALSDPIELRSVSTRYDFYLFANEESMPPRNQSILQDGLDNVIRFRDFEPIPFEETEITTINGTSKPLISVGVVSRKSLQGNGTKEAPEVVKATLVRNISKLTLEVYRKKDSPESTAEPNVKVTGFELINIPKQYPLFFSGQAFDAATVGTLSSGRVDVSISDYNKGPEEALFASAPYYLSEHLLARGGTDYTALKVYYTTGDTGTELSNTYHLDAGDVNEIRSEILDHIDAATVDLNDIDRYSVFRSLHYKVRLNITDQRVKPLLDIHLQPWLSSMQNVEYTDPLFNSTKDVVELNYEEGYSNVVQLLNNFESGSLTWSVEGDPDWLEVIPPADAQGGRVAMDGTPILFAFRAKSANETWYDTDGKPHDEEREAAITFTPQNYAHPVRVVVHQRARRLIRPERHYVCFIGEGGSMEIPVESFGRQWGATVVTNYSTTADNTGWVRAEKNGTGRGVKITVDSTNDTDLIRYAEVKLYDGTGQSAYIWVEQGNYKPVKVSENGANLIILDRNLGAIKSASNRGAWFTNSEITNRERVERNGFYYQYGRTPDGYHLLGIDLVYGTINRSIPITEGKIDPYYRPNGPLKWTDLATGQIYRKSSRDAQYGLFVSAEETAEGDTPGEVNNWFVSGTTGPQPSWTNADGSKRKGVDPCPEGYRIPTSAEFGEIFPVDDATGSFDHLRVSHGVWIKGEDIATSTARDIYFPISPRRSERGTLSIRQWTIDDGVINTSYYGLSDKTSGGGYKALYLDWSDDDGNLSWSWEENTPISAASGVVIRCIKEE